MKTNKISTMMALKDCFARLAMTLGAALILVLAACKKDEAAYGAGSAVNVINMAVDGPSVKVNAGAEKNFLWSKAGDVVGYGGNKIYQAIAGEGKSIIAVNAADTTKTIFSQTVNLQQRVNTLYIAGQSPAIETMFVEEKDVPFLDKTAIVNPDNSIYVRFVNLSPNSGPVSINIQTNPATTVNEVTALPYKGISGFKKYVAAPAVPAVGTTPAVPATPNYVFEIRNSANEVISTFTLDTNGNRFKTISLLIRGIVVTPPATTTSPFGVTQVTYY